MPVRFDWGTQNGYDVFAIRSSSSFAASQTYIATIDTSACDVAGNQLDKSFHLLFQLNNLFSQARCLTIKVNH